MIRFLVCWLLAVARLADSVAQTTDESRLQAVEVSALVQASPPQITLTWPAPPDATGYKIYKRSGANWPQVATLPANAVNWTDSAIVPGQRYEYRVVKTTPWLYIGQSYITAGVRAEPLEPNAKVLLLVRDNIAAALGAELEQLRKDLILEGWEVQRQDVAASATVPQVKSLIQSVWQGGAGRLNSVLLLGHLPVPYSGDISPDGHTNHHGAWPADGFYAEMDGTWTDSSVNKKVSERQINWNVPGDGKYDQSSFPSNVDLALGRVDFFEMTCYANKPLSRSEIDLTRQYLNKNHQFRSGQIQLSQRGLILDNFGLRETNGVAASGWRNFAAFFGAQNVSRLDLNTYFPRLRSESALWTWGAGGGSYYYSSGIGTSDDFATIDVNVVFSLWLGSYFGDWNNESNWLKAALGSGKILVSLYSGIPHSFLHNMALGGTIGDSFVLTQNNRVRDNYFPDSQGLNEVHQALLGDPTLRMSHRPPLPGFSAQGAAGRANLSWTSPGGAGFSGVHLYRGSSPNGPFTRLTSQPITASSHADAASPGTYSYLARPVWLDSNGSGSFFNLGQGSLVANVTVTPSSGTPPTPPPPPTLSARLKSPTALELRVLASPGHPVIVEFTQLFNGWTSLQTNSNPLGEPILIDLPAVGQQRLFRARH